MWRNKEPFPSSALKPRVTRKPRQWTAIGFALALLAAGCGDDQAPVGYVGNVEGYLGGIAADEPHAVLVGRDTLSAGGTAVDVAVAIYFALAVTYPNAAALGAGGSCLINLADSVKVDLVDFPSRPSGGVFAVPAAVRGMAIMHARHGRLKWGRLIVPAEQLARFGRPMSRALAKIADAIDLARLANSDLADLLLDANGERLKEGQEIRQIELAATLGRIRSAGPADLYVGQLARNLANGTAEMGAALDIKQMRGYAPVFGPAASVEVGGGLLHVVPNAGGRLVQNLWQTLFESRNILDQAVEINGLAFQKALGTAVGTKGDQVVPSAGADTGFAVVDRAGGAVACTFSMGQPFGAGRIEPTTGIMLAAAPAPGQARVATPLLLTSGGAKSKLIMAAAAGGGSAGPTALALTALDVIGAKHDLDSGMSRPRLHQTDAKGPVFHEPGLDRQTAAAIVATGVRLETADKLGRVNAIVCPKGFSDQPGSCRYGSDARGYGLSFGSEF
jgi:gamma-glutamyltranspeptidase/glutathione hydrolase